MALEFAGNALPLDQDGVSQVTDKLGVGTPELWAIITVETRVGVASSLIDGPRFCLSGISSLAKQTISSMRLIRISATGHPVVTAPPEHINTTGYRPLSI